MADRSRYRAVAKARQIGFSQVIGLEAFHGAIHQPNSLTVFVSRNERKAIDLLGYVKTMMKNLDSREYHGRPITDNDQEIEFGNGSRIVSESASPTAASGDAATRIYLDEFAKMQFAKQIYQSAAPAVSQGGSLTVLGSPKGRVGMGQTMYHVWSGSMGEAYSKHTVRWDRCPVYNPDGWWIDDEQERRRVGMAGVWYSQTRKAFTEDMWAEEYEASFIASAATIFRQDYINRMKTGWLGRFPPIPGHVYVKAADLGRYNDPTVIMVADITHFPYQPAQIVHWRRHKDMPWDEIMEELKDVHQMYPGEMWVESNGPGDVVISDLDDPDISGYYMTRKSKDNALNAAALLMEREEIKCGWEVLTDELSVYERDDKELVQDCVMTYAILAVNIIEPVSTGGFLVGNVLGGS